jgi:hypothetical protein
VAELNPLGKRACPDAAIDFGLRDPAKSYDLGQFQKQRCEHDVETQKIEFPISNRKPFKAKLKRFNE